MSSEQTLNLYPIDYPFETLVMRVEKKKLILDPDFQRVYKWDKDGDERASRFIESCLMRIPLPACYFSEDESKNHLVIDGVQRITTIQRFFNDDFALDGLTVFTDLNGKKFSELGSYKDDLENYTIRCIILRNDNPSNLVQDIFARLNEGSVVLAPQEIRHALYAGPFNDLLHILAQDPRIESFGKGKTGVKERHSQEAQEQVLRFFALRDGLEHYDDRIKPFLDNYMKENQYIDDDKVEELKELFIETLDKCYYVFGDDTFKDMTKGRPKQSLVHYDLLMKDFSNRSREFIEDKQSELSQAFVEFCNDPVVKRTMSGGTLLKNKIIARERVWNGLMDNL
ncbi:DUF262 domain-containing protein [Vibrio parahaemolyticus]|uniref:DUF262 domain-containing protein n=1 Tax=Vibrio parahaemolyticus TaxID=670 RepID=UPI00111EA691|nr:DUF262 domain-containing protein [Vibrio parahaemolyticus]EKB1982664.1 DUF262 domain-containing protein [Vibrio parahaemolyticus]EME0849484.1 DUF262 domain-containing protein [Vibrio parahaemolyticus]TOA46423.1 hypothetical protein CGK26_15265 [Vibrio parahaemolyticus]